MVVRLEISGLKIDFDTRFPEFVRRRCARYVTDADEGEADMRLRATDEGILKSDAENVGPEEAELYAMTVPFSERLPELGRLMTHGVAISCDGRGFIFTARSGVGKSTHAFLWQRHFGEERVRIINGDKPIIHFREDGKVLACGSPWNGKEGLDENVCVPLEGICLLHRLEGSEWTEPRIFPATREQTLDFFIQQTFLPAGGEKLIKTLGLLEELYDKVPVYNLYTDMSRKGIITSSDCLLGGGASE